MANGVRDKAREAALEALKRLGYATEREPEL
jgi:hypothetical protein